VMIDIHNHMLPGLDDGSPDCEHSLAMARIAVADGIRDVVCTPHWAPGAFENTRVPVLRALKEFQEKLCDNGIPLTVHPGAELRLDPDLIRKIGSGEILTLNDTGRFALIELTDMFLPRNLEVFFRNMLSRGITPVICHPERNHGLLRDPMPLFRWVEMGSLVQMTAASVTGRFGSEIRRFSFLLLEHGLAHVLGTDAHDPRMRTPVLSGGMKEVEGILGREAADSMVMETPRRIIGGERVIPGAPVPFVNGPAAASFSPKISRKIFSLFKTNLGI